MSLYSNLLLFTVQCITLNNTVLHCKVYCTACYCSSMHVVSKCLVMFGTTRCITLHFTVMHCTVYCTSQYCFALHSTVLHCTVYCTVLYSNSLCIAVPGTVLHCMVNCTTLQCAVVYSCAVVIMVNRGLEGYNSGHS